MKPFRSVWIIIACILFNSCASDQSKGFVSNTEMRDSSCISCHTNVGSIMPNDHPVVGKIDSESAKRIKEIFDVRHTSPFLDAVHINNAHTCKDCHGAIMPELDATVESRICIGCHDSYEILAEFTANDQYPDKNPHKSHLGEIDCVVCHHSHVKSKSYCLECHHKYIMPMPENGK